MSCESTITELAYLGHDNAVTIVPYSNYTDGVYYDMSAVTLVTVSADLVASIATGDDVTATDATIPAVISYTLVGTQEWNIVIKLGMFVGITAGSYKLRVTITDPTHPNGVVVADDVLVDVVEIP